MTKMKPSIHCLFLTAPCVYSDCYFYSKLIIRRKKKMVTVYFTTVPCELRYEESHISCNIFLQTDDVVCTRFEDSRTLLYVFYEPF